MCNRIRLSVISVEGNDGTRPVVHEVLFLTMRCLLSADSLRERTPFKTRELGKL
jgi:hypothetical protein